MRNIEWGGEKISIQIKALSCLLSPGLVVYVNGHRNKNKRSSDEIEEEEEEIYGTN